jgi:zinc transport system substrate-binding protein
MGIMFNKLLRMEIMFNKLQVQIPVTAISLAIVLSACSASNQAATPSESSSPSASAGFGTTGEVVAVQAAFYPLEFLANEIGGNLVQVTALTAAGAEPHDMELTPVQVAQLETTSLIIYIQGFMPAVDEAIASQPADRALDLASTVSLLSASDASEGVYDPHIWLDPANMISMASAVSERLISIAPANIDYYLANTEVLISKLQALDLEFTQGLASCEQKTLVTSHDAFGYLTNAYGFQPLGIAGLSPESEPSPARLAQIAKLVTEQGITTIYYETLVSPAIAETVAAETGATTAVLDPIEGLAAGSTDTFITVMQANLKTLIKGQSCS